MLIGFFCAGLAIDYMHWQIPLSRRFRSLKLWFVIRNYGIKGLQKHIREGVRLAQKFEELVSADSRFEIPAKRHLGMVVFRLVGKDILTEKLLKRMNSRGKLHCVPAALKDKYVIRFTVTSPYTTNEDIMEDWKEITTVTAEILAKAKAEAEAEAKEVAEGNTSRPKVFLKETRERNKNFGTSLLLSNLPNSPKVVDGSFAALFDSSDFLDEYLKTFKHLWSGLRNSPYVRRRVRGILMSGRHFSLDSHFDLFQGRDSRDSLTPPSDSRETGASFPELHRHEEEEVDECTHSNCRENRLSRYCRSQSVPNREHDYSENVEELAEMILKCVNCGHDITVQ